MYLGIPPGPASRLRWPCGPGARRRLSIRPMTLSMVVSPNLQSPSPRHWCGPKPKCAYRPMSRSSRTVLGSGKATGSLETATCKWLRKHLHAYIGINTTGNAYQIAHDLLACLQSDFLAVILNNSRLGYLPRQRERTTESRALHETVHGQYAKGLMNLLGAYYRISSSSACGVFSFASRLISDRWADPSSER